MAQRASKLCTLDEAAALVPDGARVAFGGFAVYQKPMAMVHALVRAGVRDLTVVGVAGSLEVDLLAGAGCLKRVETSYVGLERHGLAPNYRRAVQAGAVRAVHYPEMVSWDRFRADAEGLAFWPVSYLGGSDIVRKNPDIKPFPDPVTGGTLYAVPAASPDWAIVHACAADRYGNVLMQPRHLLPQSLDVAISRSTRNLIVTVERVVPAGEVMARAHLVQIPAFRTRAVVHAPHGSHPTPTLGATRADAAFFARYVRGAADAGSFAAFLDRYVLGTGGHEGYLDRVGRERLRALVREGALDQ